MHYIAKTFDCLCVLESWVLIVFLLTSFDLLLEVLQTVMAFLLLILRCSGQTNLIVIGVFIINIIITTTTTNSKEFLNFYSILWRFVSPTVTIECKSDTEIFDDFSENMKPDDFLFLAVVFVVFCLDVYFFRYGWSGLSNAAIDTFSIEELPAPCTLYFTELAPDILLFGSWILKKNLIFYTVWDLKTTLQCTWGFFKPRIFVPKISLRSINTRSTCYERWVHLKKLTGGKSLEPVYGRLWKGMHEKSRLGDVRILLLLSSLILFHISQALTLSASVSRFKAKCNTSIFHMRGGGG